MGASNGGIALRVDTSKIELQNIVKHLFGNDFEKRDNFCDTRNSDCVYIGKTKDFLIIINTDFADKFFETQKTENIQQYLNYFSNPDFVFAFEEYDSGGTYSYSLIYNGIIKRQFRSICYETKTDFGELEQAEIKWQNAEMIKDDLGDGEFEILYKDPTKDFSCNKEQLPQVILQELMLEKLGFISWNMDEFIIEQGHYKKAEKIELEHDKVTEHIIQKPWWEIRRK